MVPFLFLVFAFSLSGNSVADRISGGYDVDWEAQANELAESWMDFQYPFQRPGEIFPGLSVQDMISATGKAWYETEVREVFGLFCRDIAPSLSIPIGVPIISSLCDPVFDALNTNTRIDGRTICNGLYDHFGFGYTARRRRRRMTPGKSMLGLGIVSNFNFEKVANEIDHRIFNLYSYDQESICTAFDNFVNSEISTQRLAKALGEIVLEEGIAQGSLICQHWDAIYDNLRRTDEQPGGIPGFFVNLIENVSQLIADVSGFENREALCGALVEASPPADQDPNHEPDAQHDAGVSELADYILQNMWHTLTINEQCTTFGNDVIDAMFDIAFISRDTINEYIQLVFDLPSIGDTCAFIGSAFAFAGCDTATCTHRGSCEDFQEIFGPSFRCYCDSGFAGTDCGIEIQ